MLRLRRGCGMGGGASGGPAAAVLALLAAAVIMVAEGAPTWCIARSGASTTALQAALDYACGAGADCTPIQASGLCYLPNTLQAHASYAFNSFYQRSNMAPGTCDFGGTATVTVTDPSFGSCSYPSSLSTAGGVTPTTPSTTPATNTPSTTPATNTPTTILPPTTPTTTTTTPPSFGGVAGGGLTPGFGPTTTDTSHAAATRRLPRLPLVSIALGFVVAPLLV